MVVSVAVTTLTRNAEARGVPKRQRAWRSRQIMKCVTGRYVIIRIVHSLRQPRWADLPISCSSVMPHAASCRGGSPAMNASGGEFPTHCPPSPPDDAQPFSMASKPKRLAHESKHRQRMEGKCLKALRGVRASEKTDNRGRPLANMHQDALLRPDFGVPALEFRAAPLFLHVGR